MSGEERNWLEQKSLRAELKRAAITGLPARSPAVCGNIQALEFSISKWQLVAVKQPREQPRRSDFQLLATVHIKRDQGASPASASSLRFGLAL